ncbi:hypothetical protein [Fusobacterium varium]|uniref:hypothetical protein n=1 Tax=Fusobacterium varium TaxID=856 RepID=UPI00242AADEE|nr:hypothetical protein [Fusobacterium varium]MCF0170386.1 hypothetical protein [Fusobacterium varium]
MKNCSGISSDLERSMNLQSRIMTFEECLRNAKVIDALDDKRRVKMFNLLVWNDDMQSNFISRLDKIILEAEIEILKQDIRELRRNMKTFTEKFKKSINVVKNDEIKYEEMDDNLREFLINYAVECREKLKIENSEVETKMILENLEKRRQRGLYD